MVNWKVVSGGRLAGGGGRSGRTWLEIMRSVTTLSSAFVLTMWMYMSTLGFSGDGAGEEEFCPETNAALGRREFEYELMCVPFWLCVPFRWCDPW